MPSFPYQLRGPQAVRAVVDTVRSDPSFVAGCLVASAAHGYSIEIEYMQRADHTVRYQAWSDVQGERSTEERTVTLDFAAELARVRAAGIADRVLPPVDGAGRDAFIVLATTDGGTWIETPTPGPTMDGGRDTRGDGPLDRIFNLVFPS